MNFVFFFQLQEDLCRIAAEITDNINFATKKRAMGRVKKGTLK